MSTSAWEEFLRHAFEKAQSSSKVCCVCVCESFLLAFLWCSARICVTFL